MFVEFIILALPTKTENMLFKHLKNALILVSTSIIAQVPVNKLPGDSTLVSSKESLEKLILYDKGNYKYSIEDYFSTPKASDFQISPDGKYLSYKEKDNDGKVHVYVKDLNNSKVNRAIIEEEDLIRTYGWVNKETLYYTKD